MEDPRRTIAGKQDPIPAWSWVAVSIVVFIAVPAWCDVYKPHEVLVKFKSASQPGEPPTRAYLVSVDHVEAEVALLRKRPDIEYAEPNYVITSETVPDDWDYNPGDWAQVDLPAAWDFVENLAHTHTVRIAVLDSGVDRDHPELYEILVQGYNFIDHNADTEDDSGHGTQICGIIGAKGNNAAGVAGVAWDVPIEIMPVKVMQSAWPQSVGTVADAVEGIYYAVDNGARIISSSWGFRDYSGAMKDAIVYALDHEVLIVCSAGNEHADNDEVPHYPSNYNLENIISVAAMTRYGYLASFSNYGAHGVHIAAPGAGLKTTGLDGLIISWVDGTSYAAAFVSGVAAMVLAVEPALGVRELRLRILQGALIGDQLSEEINNCGGCVNANNALRGIVSHETADTGDWIPPRPADRGTATRDETDRCLIDAAAREGNASAGWICLLAAIVMALA